MSHSVRQSGYWRLMLVTALLCSCSSEPLPPGAERSEADEDEIAARMITAIETITAARAEDGIVPRLNQANTLGCLTGALSVPDDLPPNLQEGIFMPGAEYPATVRFASASTHDDRKKDFRGMSIKLTGVSGEPLWGTAGEQDILLNSHPALFAEDPGEFLAFVEATADQALWKFFINPAHWDAALVILRGREQISSPLDIPYWSTTPYRFGNDPSIAVKYSVRSCTTEYSEIPEDPGPSYLRANMQEQLQQRAGCFDLMVQFQADPAEMPVEDASVVWDEALSPFVPVARLTLPQQRFIDEEKLQACEDMRFNPWQTLRAHQPVGGINRVRREVYAEAGDFRLRESEQRDSQ